MTRRPKRVEARSAVTGRWVSFWYALTHPRTTYLVRRGKKEES